MFCGCWPVVTTNKPQILHAAPCTAPRVPHNGRMRPLNSNDPRQLRAWAQGLAPTHERQIAVVRDLLRHSRSDEMSAVDVAFCRSALGLVSSSSWTSLRGAS